MSSSTKAKTVTKEIDFQRLISTIAHRCWIIILVGVLCAVIFFLYSTFFVTPLYHSSVMFYVNNSAVSGDSSVSSSDIVASRNLVNSYIVILESDESLEEIAANAGVDCSHAELKNMISAASVNATEILEVVVSSPDPYEAKRIASAVAVLLPERLSSIVEGTSAKLVSMPVVAGAPSSPNITMNTIIGFLIGCVLSVGVIILKVLFDLVIRSEEEVSRICPQPILAAVPDMTAQSKGGYYDHGSGKKLPVINATNKQLTLVGDGISFAASEAYKLLRTKLQFCFADEKDCHIIGISSAMAGEGKSLTSVNLAYSLAQLDQRVLLVDCDMRRPSISAKLTIKKNPGLSNYLTRHVDKDQVLQEYSTEECSFNVISAGRTPPNPLELLSSPRMDNILNHFRSSFDYIILDLPPVGEVSDALVLGKQVDGFLLVVRQNYCNSNALSAAVDQFHFVESRVLGIVLNCSNETSGRYKKYYRGYYGYTPRYESVMDSIKRPAEQAKTK